MQTGGFDVNPHCSGYDDFAIRRGEKSPATIAREE